MKKNLLLTVIISLVGGVIGSLIINAVDQPTQNELIKSFYDVETAVMVSPHGLRKHIAQGDTSFVLVDVRSNEEYEREHVVGAVNIPAYKDPETSAYGDVQRIVQSFKDLQEARPNAEIIVYCYSIPCMTGRKVGKMLADHNIFVKELGIGWNEWRYFWTLWNHEHEWGNTFVENYVVSGGEPGTFSGDVEIAPCTIGQFGC